MFTFPSCLSALMNVMFLGLQKVESSTIWRLYSYICLGYGLNKSENTGSPGCSGVSETWWHIKFLRNRKSTQLPRCKSSVDAIITKSLVGPLKIRRRGNASNQNQIFNPYSGPSLFSFDNWNSYRSLVICLENCNSAFRYHYDEAQHVKNPTPMFI